MPVDINQYTIQTPATLLQQALTQRAEAKRKALMDTIEQQYKSAQAKNMESEATYRQQEAALAGQRFGLEKQKLDMVRAQGMQPGPVSPEQAQLAESAFPGSTVTQPGESIPAQGPVEGATPIAAQDFQAPATTMFRGDPKTQAQQRTAEALSKLTQSPEWATLSPEQKYTRAMSTPGVNPAELGAYERLLASGQKEEMVPYYDVDRQGRPIQMGKVQKNSIFKQQPSPTQPAPETQFSWTTKDAEGKDVVHFGIHPRGSKGVQELEAPGGGMNPPANLRSGNQPNPNSGRGTKTPGLYDEKVLNQYRSALKSPNGAAAAISARNQFIASITDPSLKADFMGAVKDNLTGKIQFSDAVKRIHPDPAWPPEQQKAYMDKVSEIVSELVAK